MSEVKVLLELLDSFSISKVDFASYLEVSRQMVYNYLSKDSFDEWPIKKRVKVLEMFEVESINDLENVKPTADLLVRINEKLEKYTSNGLELEKSYLNLDKDSKRIVEDIIRLCEDKETTENVNIALTLIEHSLITKEYRYLLTYLGKIFRLIEPRKFTDDEMSQMAFEGILFSAFTIFNSGKYSKEKTVSVHNQFLQELEKQSKIDKHATNVINVTKTLAKNELGIEKIDESNVNKVLEKMLEIQSRKL